MIHLTDEQFESLKAEIFESLKAEIRSEVEYRTDIYTNGDWFQERVKEALCELLFPGIESCEGECSMDLLGLLKRALDAKV